MANQVYNIPNNYNKLNTSISASTIATPSGQATPNMQQWMQQVNNRLGGVFGGVYASASSTYILQQPDTTLPNAQAISKLSPGFLLGESNGSIASTGMTTLGNSFLTNSSITINGTTISLGASGTITSAPRGTAGGDLTGSYPNPIVIKADVVSATYFGAL